MSKMFSVENSGVVDRKRVFEYNSVMPRVRKLYKANDPVYLTFNTSFASCFPI